jgi:hypothetical protein
MHPRGVLDELKHPQDGQVPPQFLPQFKQQMRVFIAFIAFLASYQNLMAKGVCDQHLRRKVN